LAEETLPLVNIGDTDRNADWILSEERRKEEIALHEELERKAREEGRE
jgi:hypothetical protein